MKNPAPKYLQNYLLTQELSQQSTISSKKKITDSCTFMKTII